MKLGEVTFVSSFEMLDRQLQTQLRRKIGDLSSDDWKVYLEVDAPKTARNIMGGVDRWIRIWLRCYADIGSEPSSPEDDLHLSMAMHLIPKEAASIYKQLTGMTATIKGPTYDIRRDKAEYWWDVELPK